jgi:hypothetical protein
MERFNLRDLNDVEVKDQYQVEISKKFAAMEASTTTTTMRRRRIPIVSERT